jgi:pimeloyl-ACP methyl ester carboxylesterase
VSRPRFLGRHPGLIGSLVGVVAASVAAGVATERYLVRRSRRGGDPYVDEPFGDLPASERLTLATDDGVDLHVEVVDADAPSDLTVVMVHGFCLDMGTFHFQRRALEGRYRMVLYDQPGHGGSGRRPKGEYTLESLGRALRAVIEQFAPTGQLALVGHSMGGMTIMALAEQWPELFAERVAGVILISTSAGRLEQVNFRFPDVLARFHGPILPLVRTAGPVTSAVLDRARSASTDLAWLLTRKYGFGPGRPSPSLVSYVEQMNSRTSSDVILRYLRTLYSHSRLVVLNSLVDLPMLVICGDHDYLTPLEDSREICKVLPEAELLVVTDGGHVALLEHSEEVNEAIEGFLAKLTPDVESPA